MLDDVNSQIKDYENFYIQQDDLFMWEYTKLTYIKALNMRIKLQEVFVSFSQMYDKKC